MILKMSCLFQIVLVNTIIMCNEDGAILMEILLPYNVPLEIIQWALQSLERVKNRDAVSTTATPLEQEGGCKVNDKFTFLLFKSLWKYIGMRFYLINILAQHASTCVNRIFTRKLKLNNSMIFSVFLSFYLAHGQIHSLQMDMLLSAVQIRCLQ